MMNTARSCKRRTWALLRGGSRQASMVAALALAQSGPLWPRLQNFVGDAKLPSAEEVAFHGEAITESLTGKATPAQETDAAMGARVYHLYLPIYFFAREVLQRHRSAGNSS